MIENSRIWSELKEKKKYDARVFVNIKYVSQIEWEWVYFLIFIFVHSSTTIQLYSNQISEQ